MKMTWTSAFDGASYLADELTKHHIIHPLSAHILIGRGGLAVGGLLARFCSMSEIIYLPVAFRGQAYLPSLRPLIQRVISPLEAANCIYLIDDIYDTGRTLEHVASELFLRGHASKVVAVTLLSRLSNRFRQGDHFCAAKILTPEYVYFPWELYDAQPPTPKEEVTV